jgi:hypothetical protein
MHEALEFGLSAASANDHVVELAGELDVPDTAVEAKALTQRLAALGVEEHTGQRDQRIHLARQCTG